MASSAAATPPGAELAEDAEGESCQRSSGLLMIQTQDAEPDQP